MLHKLTALGIKSAGPCKYNDGQGLWLVKRPDSGAQWVLRLSVFGKRREMGLGSLSAVGLKQARELAAKWRAVAHDGKDPIHERQAQARWQMVSSVTLKSIAEEAVEARKAMAAQGFGPIFSSIAAETGDDSIYPA